MFMEHIKNYLKSYGAMFGVLDKKLANHPFTIVGGKQTKGFYLCN